MIIIEEDTDLTVDTGSSYAIEWVHPVPIVKSAFLAIYILVSFAIETDHLSTNK